SNGGFECIQTATTPARAAPKVKGTPNTRRKDNQGTGSLYRHSKTPRYTTVHNPPASPPRKPIKLRFQIPPHAPATTALGRLRIPISISVRPSGPKAGCGRSLARAMRSVAVAIMQLKKLPQNAPASIPLNKRDRTAVQ